VMALARGSADSGCADSPSEAKYSRIKLVAVRLGCRVLGGTHFKKPPSSWICSSFSPLILRIASP
jgi:hypothetical protein